MAKLRSADLSDAYARPLFEPSRRPLERQQAVPPPVPISTPQQQPQDTPRFKLLGIVVDGTHSLALVSNDEGRPQRLEVGDMINGWQVTAITLTTVEVTRGGLKTTLRLTRQ